MTHFPVRYDSTETDSAEFFRLPAEERHRVGLLDTAFRAIERGEYGCGGKCAALAALATGELAELELSAERVGKLYRRWKREGWRALVRNYKAGQSKVSPAFVQWFTALHERCQRERTGATAWSLFRAQYARWQGGDGAAAIPGLGPVPPPPTGKERVPKGLGYRNLMLHLAKVSPIDTATAKRGRHKARESLPPVLHTRGGLLPGQMFFCDDSWHNSYAVHPGTMQAVRVLELCFMDVATTHRTLFGIIPRIEKEDGKKLGFAKRDMMLLTVAQLRRAGWHPDGCYIPTEGGTATIPAEMMERIAKATGGKVRFERMGTDRVAALLGDYAGAAKSNPRRKALLEGSFAFVQNRLSWTPAQTGSNARLDQPESLKARLGKTAETLAIASRLDADLAAGLPLPMPTVEEYHALITEIYGEIDGRTEHNIEGWAANHWLTPALPGMPPEAFAAMPPEARSAFLAAMSSTGATIPMRKLSPLEVWHRYSPSLRRLPLSAVPFVLGEDFFEARTVTDRHVFIVNGTYYLAQLRTADGHDYMLTPGRKYLTCLNPFEPEHLHVVGEKGEWLGVAPAWTRTRFDTAAADTPAIGVQNRILGEARNRAGFRSMEVLGQRLSAAESVNTRALTQLTRLLPKEEAEKRMKPRAAKKPFESSVHADEGDEEAILTASPAPIAALTSGTDADEGIPWATL